MKTKQPATHRARALQMLAAALVLASVLALAACGGSSGSESTAASTSETTSEAASGETASGTPIKYGVILPLSGPVATAGKEGLQAIELAADEINAAGGVNGQPLKVMAEDSQSEAQAALEAASKLVNVDKVPVVFGEYGSDISLPVGQYVTRNDVLFITPSSAPELRSMGPLEFGIAALDTLATKIAAEDLIERGFKKIAGIYPNNSYGRYIAKGLEASFEKLGGTVTETVLYQEGQSSYRTELTRMQESGPEAYVYASYGQDAATINKDAYELGLNEDTWYGIYLSAMLAESDPKATEGQIGIDQVITGKAGEEFIANYEKAYGEPPAAPFDAYAFDAVKVYAEAVEKAGTTEAKKVAEAMLETNHVGAAGKVTFDSEGQRATAAFASVEAKEGKSKTVKVIYGEN